MSDYIRMYENPSYPYERDEVERLKNQLENQATYKRGVARWKTNNLVIPDDCAKFAAHLGLPIKLDVTKRARYREDIKFINEYRKRNANREYEPEEMYEMDAAFGHGQQVVDVITG